MKYWNYLREFPLPPFPVFVHGVAVWLSVDGDIKKLHQAIRAWIADDAHGRVELTAWRVPIDRPLRASDIQFDVSDMPEAGFLALLSPPPTNVVT